MMIRTKTPERDAAMEKEAVHFADLMGGDGQPIRNLSQIRSDRLGPLASVRTDWVSGSWWGKSRIREFLASEEGVAKCDPRLLELHEKLLSFGGSETCLPIKELDLHDILDHGQLWLGDRPLMRRGEACHCHENSCGHYLRNKNSLDVTIATGYALSEDGIWRQHSWVLWRKPRSVKVLETTTKRVLYFGFAMTAEQAEAFCDSCFW